MQSTGHGENSLFAVKPMLRIVNMQKRLRPVYPGEDATDFAIDDRDSLLLDHEPGPIVQAGGEKFWKNSRYNYKLHTAAARH